MSEISCTDEAYLSHMWTWLGNQMQLSLYKADKPYLPSFSPGERFGRLRLKLDPRMRAGTHNRALREEKWSGDRVM
jgi:hypothetical protein